MQQLKSSSRSSWQQSARDDYSVYILVVFKGFVTVREAKRSKRGAYDLRVHGLKSSACFVYPIVRTPRPRRDTRCRCLKRRTIQCCQTMERALVSCTWLCSYMVENFIMCTAKLDIHRARTKKINIGVFE